MASTIAANRRGQLSPVELSAFCAQIAMILRAGIPVQEGIAIMREDAVHAAGRDILAELSSQLDEGASLRAALESTGRFPKYVVDMAEIGEEAGRLDSVMESLGDYYDRLEDTARSIKSAVTYPLVMTVMMLLTVILLVSRVLPIFREVLSQLGSEMSAFSQSLMNLGAVLGNAALILLALLAAGVLAVLVMRLLPGGRRALSGFFGSFILTRSLWAKIASGRFASAMALMLSSGLDVDRSMELAGKLVDNPRISAKIAQSQSLIAEGASFPEALERAGIFSGLNIRMVAIGLRSGAVETVMRRIAGQYEEEVNGRIAHIISILEPTLVAVLSVVVGAILISVMLPLMGVMSTIG